MTKNARYPIEEVLPELREALQKNSSCVLSAPPGAGKTTVVPAALISEEWLEGKKIIMLEPRRLAARRSAEFMARQMNEDCGRTIGYRIRNENKVSRQTRIEVVTEGILTRMLQSDMEMPEYGLIIFDEYHERSIHADTGLAFALDVQKNLRPELRILVMSATLDTASVARLLDDAPVVESEGRMYPVEIHYEKHDTEQRVEIKTAEAVLRALRRQPEGDILVFLPGRGEIARTADMLYDRLKDPDVVVHELFGEAPARLQEAAIQPDPRRRRKVILSTSIAETSLTIDGVSIVIDSGLSRISAFDVRRGMQGLITVPVSMAAAMQRSGRAGRQGPGVCYRLWKEQDNELHPEYTQPEILNSDLAPLALELIRWGSPDAGILRFPDPPPPAHLRQAQQLLIMLGAVDSSLRLTSHGRRMAELPVHPRMSSMILYAKERNIAAAACLLASLLEERDIAGRGYDISLTERWHILHDMKNQTTERIFAQAERLMKISGVKHDTGLEDEKHLGLLLAMAYPDRIAQRKTGRQYQLSGGTRAVLPERSLLDREEFLAVGDVDAAANPVRIFLAEPVGRDELMEAFGDIVTDVEVVEWSGDSLRSFRAARLGSVSLYEKPASASPEAASECIIGMLRQKGLESLPWDKESRQLRARSQWIKKTVFQNTVDWPDLSDAAMEESMDSWLAPFLQGVKKQQDIDRLNMTGIITSLFTYEQLQKLDKMAPAYINLPSGSRAYLDYLAQGQPVLAVRLQELFGQTETPRIGLGDIGVVIHLLSPAMRPLAVTQDLRSFWKNTYPEIHKQMRIKYPKHHWPDDPLTAQPTNRTKKGNLLH